MSRRTIPVLVVVAIIGLTIQAATLWWVWDRYVTDDLSGSIVTELVGGVPGCDSLDLTVGAPEPADLGTCDDGDTVRIWGAQVFECDDGTDLHHNDLYTAKDGVIIEDLPEGYTLDDLYAVCPPKG